MSRNFITKRTNTNYRAKSGMIRSDQSGKPRYDLIPLMPLKRLAELYARGAVIYGDRNWEKANSEEELNRMKASAWRHFVQYMAGESDEDHGIAAVWNLFACLVTEEKVVGRHEYLRKQVPVSARKYKRKSKYKKV